MTKRRKAVVVSVCFIAVAAVAYFSGIFGDDVAVDDAKMRARRITERKWEVKVVSNPFPTRHVQILIISGKRREVLEVRSNHHTPGPDEQYWQYVATSQGDSVSFRFRNDIRSENVADYLIPVVK